MENEMENNDDEMDEETGTMKQWFQDNLRIIISIIIVIAIAGGIYSYSKRSATPTTGDQSDQATISEELGNTGNISEEGQSATGEAGSTGKTATKPTVQVAPAGESQETDTSFIETAARGDGMTKLARRALANYLEKNPDSALTAEHKIYIEDYLRKNVAKKSVRVGTSAEFSKDLIQGAISKSKNLNANQLQNLHKYAVRVPSLS
jgi:hypothetical protein